MSDTRQSGGIGIPGCLLLILVTLKLTEVGTVATWSWLWVLSPLWLPVAFCAPVVLAIYAVASFAEWRSTRRRLKKMMEVDQ